MKIPHYKSKVSDKEQTKVMNRGTKDYQVRARDFIKDYGAQYGITGDMIDWERGDTRYGTVKLGGEDLISLENIKREDDDWKGYASREKLKAAIDEYATRNNMGGTERIKIKEKSSFAPVKSPYADKIDAILLSLQNPKPFEYDHRTDPKFHAYRDSYQRQGERSLANTMSEASALTGGRLNRWAVSAGNQAKQEYDRRLNEVIPKLEEQAYSRYLAELDMTRKNLGILADLDNEAYRRGVGERNFEYSVERDRLQDQLRRDDLAYQRKMAEDDRNYKRGRDALGDERYLEELAYQRMMKDRDFNHRASIDRDQNARAWANQALDRERFEYNKTRDELERAAKESRSVGGGRADQGDAFPDAFKAIEKEMNRTKDRRDWYLRESVYMTDAERQYAFSLLTRAEQDRILKEQVESTTHTYSPW